MEFRKLLAIIALVSLFVVSYANPPSIWTPNGIGIRQGASIEWQRTAGPIGDDAVVFIWSDTRVSDRDLFAMAVNHEGLVWHDGVSVLIDGKPDRQEDPVVIKTSDGHSIIAWVDFHFQTEDGNIMAQKISSTGELMWEETVLVCMSESIQISLNIVPNNEGGAFIIWHDQRSGSSTEIYGMHLNADGEPYSEEWVADGLPLATGRGNQHFHTFWEDGDNGAILAYVNEVDNQQDLHVKRIAPNGDFLWERDLAAGEIDYASARVQPFGDNAFGFAYTDRRDGRYKIYVKVVDLDGDDVWEESLPVVTGVDGEPWDQKNARVVGATDGNFIVVWEDYRQGGTSNIYVQKFDIEGNRLWGDDGIIIVDQELDQLNPRMESNRQGGCLIVWEDAREGGHPNIDIYMQQVTADGQIVWEENGRPVAQIPGEAFAPLAKYSGDHLFIGWGDMRNGSVGIYVQCYDMDGEALFVDNGIQIFWGLSGDSIDHRAVRNGDYVYAVWQDTRYANFGSQIKVQKIGLDGSIHFQENGISVTNHTGANQTSGRHQEAISFVPHHSGGIALSWIEQRGEQELVYAQAIGPNGEMLWDNDGLGLGIRVTTGEFIYTQDNPTIARDGNNYIIAWDQTDSITYERDVRAQKVVDGNRLWGDQGVHIAWQGNVEYPIDHYISAVISGKYIVWQRGSGTEAIIYAKMIDEDGEAADGWDDYGLIVCDYPGYVQKGIRTIGTDDGIMVLWEDMRAREGQPQDASIYAQLVNSQGQTLWQENGKAIADYGNDQVMISAQYDDGYVYVSWRDARVSITSQDIAIQKIDMEGNLLWGDPSPFVIRSPREHDTPALVKVGDTILIAWENNYGESGSDLHMQLTWAETGENIWEEEGEILCSTIKRQVTPRGIPFGENSAFMLWADGRSSGKEEIIGLYAQRIDMYLDVNVEETTLDPLAKMVLHANYPNPFNPETKISFALAQNERVNLNIYNVKGQLVKTLVQGDNLEKGNHSFVWNGTDNYGKVAGSGVYFYKLESETDSHTRKMLLLK